MSEDFSENKISQASESGPVGSYRWVICALLFFATSVNYIDRQIIGILAPTLKSELGWNEIDYSNIVFSFQLAYAIGLITIGRIIDWLGVKRGYAIAVFFWSLAAMLHAGMRGVTGFCAARFALGLSEAGNFPSAIKCVAEWFPKKERALVTGIFNAGTNVGATVAPIIVPWLTLNYGWQWAFIITGALGFIWLFFWIPVYRQPEKHPRVSKAELAYIQSDPPDPEVKIPWSALLKHRQTWAFTIGKFMTDPAWWLYLFWVPDFLKKNYQVDLKEVWLPLVIIYVIADFGSIGGGWLSSYFIKSGWSVNRARKTAMLICATCVVPIVFVTQFKSTWSAVALIGLAAAAHQGWSANLFTTVSDMFPRKAVGSVVGIGGMAGAVGGMFIAKLAGYVLEWTGSYWSLFVIAGSVYLIALGIIQMLAPNLDPVKID